MKYIPNTYDFSIIESLDLSPDEFIELQIRYRQLFEDYYASFIKANKIDDYIKLNNISIPPVDDEKYNFYHMNSNLGSKYLFLRNNVHIERLNISEIQEMMENPSREFIDKTFKKVFIESENNSSMFFGMAVDGNEALSNGLVFEFSYDMKRIQTVEQLRAVNELLNRVRDFIENDLSSLFNVEVSLIEYKAIPDLFIESKNGSLLI